MLPDSYRVEFHVSSLSVTKCYSVKFGKNTEKIIKKWRIDACAAVILQWVLNEVLTGSCGGRVGLLNDRLFLRELSLATKLHGIKLRSENCSTTCIDLLLWCSTMSSSTAWTIGNWKRSVINYHVLSGVLFDVAWQIKQTTAKEVSRSIRLMALLSKEAFDWATVQEKTNDQ